MIGFDTALFVEAPPEYASCSVCLGVLNDPHSCLQGHRRARTKNRRIRVRANTAATDALRRAVRRRAPCASFCKGCITSWLKRTATCPLDRGALRVTQMVPNRGLRASVEALHLRCPNEPPPPPPAASKKRSRDDSTLREGALFLVGHTMALPTVLPPPRCGWSGALGGLPAHLAACLLQKVRCRWQPQGCNKLVQRRRLVVHEAACDFRTTPCALCSDHVLHHEMEQHLSEDCAAALVCCEADGCSAQVPRAQLEAHHAVCPKVQVCCPVDGCGKQLARCQLAAHLAHTGKAHVRLLAAHFSQLLAEAEADEEDEEEADEDSSEEDEE
jgi:hypothetical protein